MPEEFVLFSWVRSIPFADDLWLGMQAQNIALVDMAYIRPLEHDALEAYMERERTPVDQLMPLSAISQMWVFSLYEFLRTWRQRANFLIKNADEYEGLADSAREAFLRNYAKSLDSKRRMLRIGPEMYGRHLEQIADKDFVQAVRSYKEEFEPLFRDAEALRVTLAKHEIPKTQGMFAEAPGYGRMSYKDGSMYWSLVLKDESMIIVNRRELANSFFRIKE